MNKYQRMDASVFDFCEMWMELIQGLIRISMICPGAAHVGGV